MKPIAIIGGGIAGLAAGWWLREKRVPFILVEAGPSLGGRFETIRSTDWTADPSIPYLRKSDRTIIAVAREFGLETQLVTVQDAILHMTDEGLKPPTPRDYNEARVCLRDGMDTLFQAAAREMDVHTNIAVEAIRWTGNAFQFRDSRTGRSIRHPVSGHLIEAPAVVLAVSGESASQIVRKSALLAPVAKAVDEVEYKPNLVGLFKVPRMDPGFYAIERNPSPDLQWIGFEERKVPSRTKPEWSLVVARAGESMSRDLMDSTESEALEQIYGATRKHVTDLPLRWNEARLVRYRSSRPLNPMVDPGTRTITDPPGLPLAIAGDYVSGKRAEDAAKSGVRAAALVVERLQTAVLR